MTDRDRIEQILRSHRSDLTSVLARHCVALADMAEKVDASAAWLVADIVHSHNSTDPTMSYLIGEISKIAETARTAMAAFEAEIGGGE